MAVVLQMVVRGDDADTVFDGRWAGIPEGAVKNVLQRQPSFLIVPC